MCRTTAAAASPLHNHPYNTLNVSIQLEVETIPFSVGAGTAECYDRLPREMNFLLIFISARELYEKYLFTTKSSFLAVVFSEDKSKIAKLFDDTLCKLQRWGSLSRHGWAPQDAQS